MIADDLVTRLTRHIKTLEHSDSTKVLLNELLSALSVRWNLFHADDQSWKNKELLVTDGGMVIYAFWDSVDYDEFRGQNVMGFNYGAAEIDSSNFHPTHWIDLRDMLPSLPEPLPQPEPEYMKLP
jgi:hypothetical protein